MPACGRGLWTIWWQHRAVRVTRLAMLQLGGGAVGGRPRRCSCLSAWSCRRSQGGRWS